MTEIPGIAILAIDLKQLEENTKNSISYAVLGSSLSVAQGNIAIAIGSPLGTNYSIGTGNITSVGNVIHTADATYTVFTDRYCGKQQQQRSAFEPERRSCRTGYAGLQ